MGKWLRASGAFGHRSKGGGHDAAAAQPGRRDGGSRAGAETVAACVWGGAEASCMSSVLYAQAPGMPIQFELQLPRILEKKISGIG